MAFTRFNYDECRTKKILQESTGPGRYMLNTPGIGCKPCYTSDPQARLQKWGGNLRYVPGSHQIDIDSDLIGLTRKLTHDCTNKGFPKKGVVISEKVNLVSSKFFNIDRYFRQYGIIFLLVLIIAFLFPSGKMLQYSYQLNDITQEPIIAPITFAIQKSEEQLKIEKNLELKSVPFIFDRRDDVVNLQIDKVKLRP